MHMKRISALTLLLLAGCSYVPTVISPHRIEIQQGNYVTQEMVAQLKPGMTKDQVRFVLGTPLVVDVFRDDRWDYVFVRQRSNRSEVEQRRIAVYFADGKLSRVDGDVVAMPSKDAATAGAPRDSASASAPSKPETP
jgi:outer membrane protein assembly factor BamE